ncbi:hypothetical protein [Streptomyces sp. NPDC085932]|uniref:hypothetical protein n=1 Tax=Streptomyces sp. NPDC085932 TaxID=3365741 RepID=UPI0037D140E8
MVRHLVEQVREAIDGPLDVLVHNSEHTRNATVTRTAKRTERPAEASSRLLAIALYGQPGGGGPQQATVSD